MAPAWVTTENGIFNSAPHRGLRDGQCRLWHEMSDLQLRRLGLLMEPEPGNPLEAQGVLNPAAVRGPDGQLYLFPRLVARGNYSRIGIARVLFNEFW